MNPDESLIDVYPVWVDRLFALFLIVMGAWFVVLICTMDDPGKKCEKGGGTYFRSAVDSVCLAPGVTLKGLR